MPRNQYQFHHAPVGMASDVDAGSVRENFAQHIQSFLPGRNGKLETTPPLVEIPETEGSNAVTGIALYYNPFPATQADFDAGRYRNDRLIIFRGGLEIWSHTVAWDETAQKYVVGGGTHVGDIPDVKDGNRSENLNLRTVMFEGELFMVAGDGSQPYRFWVDSSDDEHMAQVGMDTPATPSAVAGVAGALDGTYSYVVVYVDERDRESSPSTAVSLSASNQKVTVTFTWGTDDQVTAVRIYRTLDGESDQFFLVTEITNTATTSYLDNNADDDIAGNDTAPLAGANDPPHRASLITIYKRRLLLNDRNLYDDTTDIACTTRIQVSNLDKLTQFNFDNWQAVGNDKSDEITVVSSFGSLCHVATASRVYQSEGGTPLGDADRTNDFSDLMAFMELLQGDSSVGCVAPDTWVHCGNVIHFLSTDGPKRFVSGSGFSIEDFGLEINDQFRGLIQVAR